MVERVKPQAPKITKFDRNACMILRADLEMALAGIAAKHGIKIDLGKMGFSAHNVKVSLEAAVIGEGGIVLDRAAIDFKQLASLYSLEADDLGKEFTFQGTQFRITGLNTRAEKMPVQGVQISTGKEYKFPVRSILRALGRPVPSHLMGDN